ncbi:MAG: hypothetical protein JWO90_2319 [Solirubrobacterales bacterium]|jgi:hypothetical protein|nr:hypothetical protein [Solirubrobacterales bacterium]
MTPERDPDRSSAAVGGRGRKNPLPLALGLLALLLLVLVVGLLSCGGDGEVDEEGAVSKQTLTTITAGGGTAPARPVENQDGQGSAAQETTPEESALGGSAPEGGATGEGGTSGTTGPAARLTAGGASLLDRGADAIAEHVGEDAAGEGLEVLSVARSGFFVGSSERDRQYVEFGGDVGGDETDRQMPKVGDRVSLSGPVRRAPEDAGETLDLADADAMLVEDRGAYLNADSVTPAGQG